MGDKHEFEVIKQFKHKDLLDAIVQKEPAFDCFQGKCKGDCPGYPRSDGRNHGVGSTVYRFILKGEGLGVQFVYHSGEFLPDTYVPEEAQRYYPMAFDIGYHSALPIYGDEWDYTIEDCNVLGGGLSCVYDGSSLQADEYLKTLVNDGEEALWNKLEEYFYETMTWIHKTINNRSSEQIKEQQTS